MVAPELVTSDVRARLANVPELGDRPMPAAELGPYLDDLERLNAWFGGFALTARAIERLAKRVARTQPLVVVDVGGARGDLAVRLVERARRRARRIVVLVVDRDEASLVMGRRATKAYPEIRWLQADACALPLRDRSVDVASTALTVHHLEPPEAVAALAGMRRVARVGAVVNDLMRSAFALGLVVLATRLFARHPASLVDGPLSVRRAYSPAELRDIARRAGFERFAVRRYPWLARLVAVGS